MKEHQWRALQEEAPAAVGLCLRYFQDRYIGQWLRKMAHPPAIMTYLEREGVILTVTTFGVPSRTDWYYELEIGGELLAHRRDFPSYEAAAAAGIRAAFLELERRLPGTSTRRP